LPGLVEMVGEGDQFAARRPDYGHLLVEVWLARRDRHARQQLTEQVVGRLCYRGTRICADHVLLAPVVLAPRALIPTAVAVPEVSAVRDPAPTPVDPDAIFDSTDPVEV